MSLFKLLYSLAEGIAPQGMLPNGLQRASVRQPAHRAGKLTREDLERLDAAQVKRQRKAAKRKNQHEQYL